MKKNFFLVSAVVAMAATAAWNVSISSNEREGLTDVALANVEALAKGEESGDCAVYYENVWDRFYREDGTGYNCAKIGNECC